MQVSTLAASLFYVVLKLMSQQLIQDPIRESVTANLENPETSNIPQAAPPLADSHFDSTQSQITIGFNSHVNVYMEQSRLGALILLFRWSFACLQVIATLIILIMYNDNSCSVYYQICLWMHLILSLLVFIFLPRYFSPKVPARGDSNADQQERARKRLIR